MIDIKNKKINLAFLNTGFSIVCITMATAFLFPQKALTQDLINCINFWTNPNTGKNECFNNKMIMIVMPQSEQSVSVDLEARKSYYPRNSYSCVNDAGNKLEKEAAQIVDKLHNNLSDIFDSIDEMDKILESKIITPDMRQDYENIIAYQKQLEAEYNSMFDSHDKLVLQMPPATSSKYTNCIKKSSDKLESNLDIIIPLLESKPSSKRLNVTYGKPGSLRRTNISK